jgi:hypothetical protein
MVFLLSRPDGVVVEFGIAFLPGNKFDGRFPECQAETALHGKSRLLQFGERVGEDAVKQGTRMIKSFGMLHKRSDISQDQFHAHWRGPHAEHAVKLVPVMRRYVQNHRAARPYPGFQPPSDGCPEVWLEDLGSAFRLTTMPEYMTGAFIDEPAFMRVRSEGVLVKETVVVAGPALARHAAPVKALFFLKRAPGLSRATFEAAWRNREAPLLVGGDSAQRWVKSFLVEEAYAASEPLYDGVEELWWPDQAAHDRDAAAATDRSADKIVDRAATRAMFVDENRVVWDD